MSCRLLYFAPSALPEINGPLPRALPWAVTFRAFGASAQEFSHSLYREVVLTSLLDISIS
jgi:hypothetical protein